MGIKCKAEFEKMYPNAQAAAKILIRIIRELSENISPEGIANLRGYTQDGIIFQSIHIIEAINEGEVFSLFGRDNDDNGLILKVERNACEIEVHYEPCTIEIRICGPDDHVRSERGALQYLL